MRSYPILKTEFEIDVMQKAGEILAFIHAELAKMIEPGISTMALELRARKLMEEKKITPAFLGYSGFPAVACISVNEEIVHGIPSVASILKNGDVVSIDLGVVKDGFFSDAARTYIVGNDSVSTKQGQKLVEETYKALLAGIDAFQEGNTLLDISTAIYNVAQSSKLGVVYQYCGHGIGRLLHEDPPIYNYPAQHISNFSLKEGMVFAIEPMFTLGSGDTELCEDGWTVITRDRSCAAHWEHTVALTKKGPVVLTLCE